jgi:hypothetical protein
VTLHLVRNTTLADWKLIQKRVDEMIKLRWVEKSCFSDDDLTIVLSAAGSDALYHLRLLEEDLGGVFEPMEAKWLFDLAAERLPGKKFG